MELIDDSSELELLGDDTELTDSEIEDSLLLLELPDDSLLLLDSLDELTEDTELILEDDS